MLSELGNKKRGRGVMQPEKKEGGNTNGTKFESVTPSVSSEKYSPVSEKKTEKNR